MVACFGVGKAAAIAAAAQIDSLPPLPYAKTPGVYALLKKAKPTWGADELCKVYEKLSLVDIHDASALEDAISAGKLNDLLASAGQRRLKASTLQQIRYVLRPIRKDFLRSRPATPTDVRDLFTPCHDVHRLSVNASVLRSLGKAEMFPHLEDDEHCSVNASVLRSLPEAEPDGEERDREARQRSRCRSDDVAEPPSLSVLSAAGRLTMPGGLAASICARRNPHAATVSFTPLSEGPVVAANGSDNASCGSLRASTTLALVSALRGSNSCSALRTAGSAALMPAPGHEHHEAGQPVRRSRSQVNLCGAAQRKLGQAVESPHQRSEPNGSTPSLSPASRRSGASHPPAVSSRPPKRELVDLVDGGMRPDDGALEALLRRAKSVAAREARASSVPSAEREREPRERRPAPGPGGLYAGGGAHAQLGPCAFHGGGQGVGHGGHAIGGLRRPRLRPDYEADSEIPGLLMEEGQGRKAADLAGKPPPAPPSAEVRFDGPPRRPLSAGEARRQRLTSIYSKPISRPPAVGRALAS